MASALRAMRALAASSGLDVAVDVDDLEDGLGLPPSDNRYRAVLTVLAYLNRPADWHAAWPTALSQSSEQQFFRC